MVTDSRKVCARGLQFLVDAGCAPSLQWPHVSRRLQRSSRIPPPPCASSLLRCQAGWQYSVRARQFRTFTGSGMPPFLTIDFFLINLQGKPGWKLEHFCLLDQITPVGQITGGGRKCGFFCRLGWGVFLKSAGSSVVFLFHISPTSTSN